MAKLFFLAIAASLLIGCNRHHKLNVFLENSSDIQKEIVVESYLNSKLLDKRTIKRGKEIINWESFSVDLPASRDSFKFSVRIPVLNIDRNVDSR